MRVPSVRILRIGHGSVSGTIASGATLIHFTKDRGGLKAGFDHCVNRFLDQIVPTYQLSPALVHPNLDRWLEPFAEVSDEIGIFWSPISIKL